MEADQTDLRETVSGYLCGSTAEMERITLQHLPDDYRKKITNSEF